MHHLRCCFFKVHYELVKARIAYFEVVFGVSVLVSGTFASEGDAPGLCFCLEEQALSSKREADKMTKNKK